MQTASVIGRRRERGQTIVLVAISIVSLLAMAALAIDVVTLYVARTEIQRAADAAALAGAKAIADSGVTTLPSTDSNCTAAVTLAHTMATAAINAVLPNNLVSGTAPALMAGSPSFTNLTGCPANDPEVTVSLQRTGLPTFFAHIWGTRAATTGASATAEAYNPANSTGNFTPIAPRNVKPWLVANLDPYHAPAGTFVTAGAVETGAIGETFYLTSACGPGATCSPTFPLTATNGPPREVQYIPALVTANASNVCPSCLGPKDFERSIECSDANAYAYLSCGGGAANAQWDSTVIPAGAAHETRDGVFCLTHETSEGGPGSNSGQDILTDPSPWPAGPKEITAESGPQSGNKVSTSSSIVSIPLINPTVTGTTVTIMGYLQAFINYVSDGSDGSNADDVNITVLNVVGCGTTNNGATPILGGTGTSPIPVRLITP
ncbi:MAG: hypothetical protein JOZ80_08195 [Acidobacteriaceae bacterium]|nr:hypothetical protein [Acidobacteriaceae bacterium]